MESIDDVRGSPTTDGDDVSEWLTVGPSSALTEGERLELEIDGLWIAILRSNTTLHAFEDRCTHDGESLSGAEVEAEAGTPCGVVICPRHGARFCLATGAALTPPAYEALRLFAVRERDGVIEVRAPS